MEQPVFERHFYLEWRSGHSHTWRNDTADRIGTPFQQDPYRSGDSRRWMRRDRGNMYSGSFAGKNREFLSDRSDQGLPYLHSEFTNSERSVHYWNGHQRHEIETESCARYVDNNYRTLEYSRFRTDNMPRIAEASCDYSTLSSRKRDVVNPRGNLRTVHERTMYDLDTQHHQGAAATSSKNLHFHRGNVAREDRFRGGRPPQDFHVGSVPLNSVGGNAHQKGRRAKQKFVHDRDVASGSGSSKRKGSEPASYGDDHFEPEVNFTMGRRRKKQFACDRDIASRSRSSVREKSRPARNLGGNKPKPQVCRKFTKGRCFKGSVCRFLHSFHNVFYSTSQRCPKPDLEAAADLTSIGQADHCVTTTITQEHEDTEPIRKTNSKRRRVVHSSSKSGVGSMIEEVTDISYQRLPRSSVVLEKDATGHITNTASVVLEKGALDVVNINLNRDINENFEETKLIVKTKSKKSRGGCESKSSQRGVGSMTEEVTDISSQRLPLSSMGGTSLDLENATEHIRNTNSNRSQKRRSRSSKCGVESMIEEVTDILSRRLPVSSLEEIALGHENVVSTWEVQTHSPPCDSVVPDISSQRWQMSSMGGTAMDHESAVSVSGVPDDLSTSVPKTDVIKAVLENGRPVASDLTSSLGKCNVSPVSAMLVVLEKVDTVGLNVDLSQGYESPVKNNEIAVVNMDLNNEVNGKSETRKLVVKKAKMRRCRDSSSKSDVEPMTEEMTDTSCQILPVNSMIGTSLDHEDVAMPVSGITDVVSTMDFPRTAAVLEKDELAGATIDLICEVNEKLEETKHLVKTNSKKRKIEPEETKHMLNTTKVVLEKDEVANVNIDLMNDKPKATKHIVNIYTGRELLDSSSKCGVESVTKQFTNAPSLRLLTGSMGGTSLDHESVMPVSVVTDVIRPVLENDRLVEEQGNRAEAMEVLNIVEPFSDVPEEVILKSRRKLLVLDVNGLLADIVKDFPHKYTPDVKLSGKGVFKRPFCEDFLNFCFENFDVGIWSSRNKINLTMTVEFLMGNTTGKLLFCWDKSHCTEASYNTLENLHKPLLLKELTQLWENKDRYLPWQRGFYDESNTILLDDSPYKALHNPPFTAVFPRPYSFENVEDTSLGPDGDIRLYLERLAEAANVQHFIEANPFW